MAPMTGSVTDTQKSSPNASANASGPQGYQSTGLWASPPSINVIFL